MALPDHQPVVVITGAGGIGSATARRLGSGKLLVIADFNATTLESTAQQLKSEGFNVRTFALDISNADAVSKFADDAAALGHIETVVHAAGVGPTISTTKVIYDVDLLGTAYIIDAFQPKMEPGSSLVCVGSGAAHVERDFTHEVKTHFRRAATAKLLETPAINLEADDPPRAYGISKRANILRVQAASSAYGARGARINIVSPGLVATELGHATLSGPYGVSVKGLIAHAPIPRTGTAVEVADAIAFLAGPTASYITAADLVVDGGQAATFLKMKESRREAGL